MGEGVVCSIFFGGGLDEGGDVGRRFSPTSMGACFGMVENVVRDYYQRALTLKKRQFCRRVRLLPAVVAARPSSVASCG